jgi:hypothetical protein
MKTSLVLVCASVIGCGGSSQTGFALTGDGGTASQGDAGGGGGGTQLGGDAGLSPDSGSGTGGSSGPPLIYAHTDTELYSMDPTTHAVTDIGPFSDGSGSTPTITDLAVDGSGDVFVNSETAIYTATIPTSGTGTVNITLRAQLQTGTKFYALGFTPAGTLESGESLIAGDSAGSLYYIPSTGSSVVPQNLGGFGGSWELSGDVVFFTSNGSTIGLATIRQCDPTCDTKNDSLAEIDMAALKQAYTSQTPSTALLQQVLGSGTGFGDLFGIGAWGSSVYAFSREQSGGTPAQLVQVDSSGTGTSLQSFTNITSGWSGAGVTTKAPVTILQ